MLTFLTWLLLVFLQSPTPQPTAQTTARPALEFEKTRFAAGERVFFWLITARDPKDDKPIPRTLMDSGRVIFTRPDGTERVDKVGAPMDGMGIDGPGDMGWKGGWELRDAPIQLGQWGVVYEFAGVRTKPVTFTVEDWPILKDIHAAFEFSNALVLEDSKAIVTLVVRNDSSETIRFVQPGQNNNFVSFQISKPGWGSSGFVPESVLADASGHKHVPMSIDRLDWDAIGRFPSVALAPGESYRLKLSLTEAIGGARAVEKVPDGSYNLRFATELQLLVGERNGRWNDFVPVRLRTESATTASRR
jgi:hypothetical protein